ncbi:MAG: NUDIX domain-containing protein [Eubacteriales bacterium]
MKEPDNMHISDVEVTNMVMICDAASDSVLCERRVKNWCGVAFPGGHLENGESLYESAVREVREETGLDVSELKYCGVIHWSNADTGSQTFIHYYKTSVFSGTLTECDEGELFWCPVDKLRSQKLSPGFETQLDMFFNDRVHELLIIYDDKDSPLIYRWF